MKRSTLEWIDKAEGDFATAAMACRARKRPNYDAACFHAQQCADPHCHPRIRRDQKKPKRRARHHAVRPTIPPVLEQNSLSLIKDALGA